MMDPKDKKYTNGEITVFWKPGACIHATTCYRELIEVFNPRNRPWVNMQGASTKRIIEVVKKCPTEALSYEWNDSSKKSEKPHVISEQKLAKDISEQVQNKPVEIRVMKGGPYIVGGDFRVINSSGLEMKKMIIASFCRCGQSDNMPYCDGSHRAINFNDSCE